MPRLRNQLPTAISSLFAAPQPERPLNVAPVAPVSAAPAAHAPALTDPALRPTAERAAPLFSHFAEAAAPVNVADPTGILSSVWHDAWRLWKRYAGARAVFCRPLDQALASTSTHLATQLPPKGRQCRLVATAASPW